MYLCMLCICVYVFAHKVHVQQVKFTLICRSSTGGIGHRCTEASLSVYPFLQLKCDFYCWQFPRSFGLARGYSG